MLYISLLTRHRTWLTEINPSRLPSGVLVPIYTMPFLGSNTALFPGQAVADLYCSNYWLPAPVTPNIPAPGPGGQWPWIRLRNECVGVGWTFFVLEETVFGPGVPNAMWNFMAPGVQAAMLSVLDGGHILFPVRVYDMSNYRLDLANHSTRLHACRTLNKSLSPRNSLGLQAKSPLATSFHGVIRLPRLTTYILPSAICGTTTLTTRDLLGLTSLQRPSTSGLAEDTPFSQLCIMGSKLSSIATISGSNQVEGNIIVG